MDTVERCITDASRAQIRTLLENEQAVPQESLFQDNLFEAACRRIRNNAFRHPRKRDLENHLRKLHPQANIAYLLILLF
jgi:hypothetical protein